MNINDAYPSKYLKASDLDKVPNRECTLTIASVVMEDVGTQDAPETKPIVHFHGTEKGLVLNKTNALNLEVVFGPETDNWLNQKVILFAQPVMFAGRQVQGLRVRPQPAVGTPLQTTLASQPVNPVQPGSALAQSENPAEGLDNDPIPF